MPRIDTIEELMQVLDEHPQWLEALRTRLLTRELIELPRRFAEFSAAVDQNFARAERRMDGMERTISGMSQRMDGMERTISGMSQRMDGMEQTMGEMSGRVDGIEQTTVGMSERMDSFATKDQQQKIVDDVGWFKGFMAENAARQDAPGMAMDMGFAKARLLTREEAAHIAYSPALEDLPRNERISFRKADAIIEASDAAGETSYVALEASTPPTSATRRARSATPTSSDAPQAARPAPPSPTSAPTTGYARASSPATSTGMNSRLPRLRGLRVAPPRPPNSLAIDNPDAQRVELRPA